MSGPNTVTISAAELDALLAIERAANVLAAGDLVDPEETAKVRDALPHLLEDLALTRPVTSPITALADRLPRRFVDGGVQPGAEPGEAKPAVGLTNGGVVPLENAAATLGARGGRAPRVSTARRADLRMAALARANARLGLDEAHAQDRWVAEMAARGALTPEHRAAYTALVNAGMQPHQLRFLANAITCGVAAPATEKES